MEIYRTSYFLKPPLLCVPPPPLVFWDAVGSENHPRARVTLRDIPCTAVSPRRSAANECSHRWTSERRRARLVVSVYGGHGSVHALVCTLLGGRLFEGWELCGGGGGAVGAGTPLLNSVVADAAVVALSIVIGRPEAVRESEGGVGARLMSHKCCSDWLMLPYRGCVDTRNKPFWES